MRKGISLAAAALSVSLAVTFISPVNAQTGKNDAATATTSATATTTSSAAAPASSEASVPVTVPSSAANGSSAGCIGVGLAAGLPLLFLLPVGIAANIALPGFEALGQFNAQIQQQLGIFNEQLAIAAGANAEALRAGAGVLGAVATIGLAIGAISYLATECTGTEGSSGWLNIERTTSKSAEPTTKSAEPTTKSTEPTTESSTAPASEPEKKTDLKFTFDGDKVVSHGSIVIKKDTKTEVTLPELKNVTIVDVKNLPEGLTYKDGVISGTATKADTKTVTVTVKVGEATQDVKVKVEVVDPAAASATSTTAASTTSTTSEKAEA